MFGGDAAAPATIGPYRLIRSLGSGGMGEVYLAAQTGPLRREVALKLIKVGMDTREVIHRFESERQALAMMNHPHVARIFDAGATETGRPYFVMEYVPGESITTYCDRHALDLRSRLELFVPVCQAIQHAHQKGIIHRDIKPSNVLVTLENGRPVPKVIDFGVAKAVQPGLDERTALTAQGQLLGTPAYMSPEQAAMTGRDLDTTSDVYSLGVLLYEMLVGTPPFDARELRAAGIAEIHRIIREVDPPRPSTRVSSLGAEASAGAARRGIAPRTWRRQLDGELDWITMRAMEKDRARRYPSASELAGDVERYLAGEAVAAGPVSAGYRLRKFYGRHRAIVGWVAFAFLALAAGLATSLGLYARAEAARRDADRQGYYASIRYAAAALEDHDLVAARTALARCPDHLRHWEWHYLESGTDHSLLVVEPGLGPLTAVDWSADGRWIAVGSRSGRVGLWDDRARTFTVLADTFAGSVAAVGFSRDGGMLAAGARNDGNIRVWSAHAGEPAFRIPVVTTGVTDLAYATHDSNLYYADGLLHRVALRGEATPVVTTYATIPVTSFAFAPAGNRLLGKRSAVGIALYSFPDGRELRSTDEVLRAGEVTGRPFIYRPEADEAVVVVRPVNFVQILVTRFPGLTPVDLPQELVASWDLAGAGRPQPVLRAYSMVRSLAQTGRTTVVGDRDGRITRYRGAMNASRGRLTGHTDAVTGLVCHADTLASVSTDGAIRLWALARPARTRSYLDPLESSDGFRPILELAASGPRTLLLRHWRAVSLLDVDTGQETGLVPPRGARLPHTMRRMHVLTAAADREGRVVVVWQDSPTETASPFDVLRPSHDPADSCLVQIWDGTATGPLAAFTPATRRHHAAAAVNVPRGLLVLGAAGGDTSDPAAGCVDLVSLADGSLVGRLGRPRERVRAVASGESGRFVAWAAADGAVTLHDLERGRDVFRDASLTAAVTCLRVDRSTGLLAAGTVEGDIMVRSLARAGEPVIMRGHAGAVVGLVFHPDGRRLFSRERLGAARIWDVATGEAILPLAETMTGSVGAGLHLSADGGRLYYPESLVVRSVAVGHRPERWTAARGDMP